MPNMQNKKTSEGIFHKSNIKPMPNDDKSIKSGLSVNSKKVIPPTTPHTAHTPKKPLLPKKMFPNKKKSKTNIDIKPVESKLGKSEIKSNSVQSKTVLQSRNVLHLNLKRTGSSIVKSTSAESKIFESKVEDSKSTESTILETKISESKISESKSEESKFLQSEIEESKSAESKLIESKITESKSAESKLLESKTTTPTGKLSLISTNRSSNTGFLIPRKHKMGEVPDYMKRRNSLNSIDPIVISKRKSYLACKKKVADAQTDFLAACKNLEDVQKNLKAEDKDYIKLDRYQLMVISKDDEGKLLLMKNGDDKELLHPKKKISVQQLNEVSDKMSYAIESGYKLCQEFIDNIKTSKMVNNDLIGDGTLDKSEVMKMLLAMERTVDLEMKNKVKITSDLLQTVNYVQIPQNISNKELDGQVFELNDKISQLKKNLEDNKIKAQQLELKVRELENSNQTSKKELETDLNQKQKELSTKEVDMLRLKKALKTAEEHKTGVDLKNESLMNELIETKNKAATLQSKLEQMKKHSENVEDVPQRKELRNKDIELKAKIAELKNKEIEFKNKENDFKNKDIELKNKEIELKNRENDFRTKEAEIKNKEMELEKLYREEQERSKMLENKLKDTEKDLENIKQGNQTNKNNADDHYDPQLWTEFQKLKMSYDKITYERDALKKSLQQSNSDDLTYLRNNLVKTNLEIQQYENENKNLIDNVQELQSELTRKNKKIKEYEDTLSSTNITNYQNEINGIREAEQERKLEVENLKNELGKCRIEIKQQEETIYMHTRLLRIRSELINSLQEKEASTRCCMEDLYAEIAKKTNLINQMNHEISAKAEELQNLFSTLGNKEMELSRQETIIKMLEENDTRNQRLRVKQEEKISRLEHENSELKHVISIYQDYNPDLNFKEINNNFLEAKSAISTRDFFNEERRGKRQIEIEVKKIEKY